MQFWNYKWEADTDTPPIGPMAQDFKAESCEIQNLRQRNDSLERRLKELEAAAKSHPSNPQSQARANIKGFQASDQQPGKTEHQDEKRHGKGNAGGVSLPSRLPVTWALNRPSARKLVASALPAITLRTAGSSLA